ncbi:MAG: hypothetical protein IK152_01930 [Lachnospiraceae bacterium]|nr:hypothetical protein [Lachnospiraceae bacterium]
MIERVNPVYEKKKKRGRALRILAVVGTILVVLSAVYIFVFHLKEVTYSGNKHYSEQELNEMFLSDGMSGNSLFVLVKYTFFVHPGGGYLDHIKVSMKSPSHLHIDVYEKTIVGCVEYSDMYMYFDSEGLVIDSSTEKYNGIPLIAGISFDQTVVGEKLPIEDKGIFERILNLSGLLMKYDLKPDKVYFDELGKVTLHFEEVRVELGKDDNLKLKIADLAEMIPALRGKAGVLHMENYNPDSDGVTFTEDKEPEPPKPSEEPSSSGEPSSSAEPQSSSVSQQSAPASSAPQPSSTVATPSSSV